jgi:hypothetical protein
MFKQKICGFDIETYGKKNEFLCATVYHDDDTICFRKSRMEIIEHFKAVICRNKIIATTMLGFDFHGLFHDLAIYFDMQYRNGQLLSAKTYVYEDKFVHPVQRKINLNSCQTKAKYDVERKKYFSLTFIDTIAYKPASVETLGEIVGIKKLEHPKAFQRIPKDDDEWAEMEKYNIQDSKISKVFTEFLYKGLIELGCTIKSTIGSCAMSLFKNKYLKEDYFCPDKEDTLKMFNGY